MRRSFQFYKQLNSMDCGLACLRMVCAFYGKVVSLEKIRKLSGHNKMGVNLLGLNETAEILEFRTRGIQITYEQLFQEAKLPAILHWNQRHFVVLISVKNKLFSRKHVLTVADPARQIIEYDRKEFLSHWVSTQSDDGLPAGTALLLEPNANFTKAIESEDVFKPAENSESRLNWKTLLQYLRESRWQLFQVLVALLLTSLFQLVFPFLTQNIVDTGINYQDISFISILLIGQLMLVFSRTFVDFIRSRLLLQISIRINFTILSDFWIKLTRLPINYFDSFHTGDTLQRLGDSKKIESFLTGTALTTIFSIFNFTIFSLILTLYDIRLFVIFAAGSALYFAWIRLFLRYRRKINYQNFYLSAKENNASLQLIQGMQELKLNSAENLKRWEWENIQAAIFKISFRNLSYSQLQQSGALFISEGKNVLLTFFTAKMVVTGQLTLGAMMAIQYILGQLNGPIEQFISFMQSSQDAKISLERLNEVHRLKDEEATKEGEEQFPLLKQLPPELSISLQQLSFSYPGAGNEPVLDNINLTIPEGKTTAIVGVSGSGKTTLLKLLLRFYDSYLGSVMIGQDDVVGCRQCVELKKISPAIWRKHCGAVMQDGYIFNDSIAKNIAVGYERPDHELLVNASKIANIHSFIHGLPNGFNTMIGANGTGISQGQRQRILIARAIYKNPKYIFFDEATNALDANNEKAIVENLLEFFKGRTVVVVAHRLSTVKNADKIVVLQDGRILEEGTHAQLSALRGRYFELVKNQLELGN